MNDIKLIMNDFYDYLKKEKAFSSHTVDAYQNDLDRFISSLPKTLSDLNQIDNLDHYLQSNKFLLDVYLFDHQRLNR